MKDKINIKNLVVYGVIGINSWERETKQKIEIDLEIESDLSKAMISDDINDTVNYRTISKNIIQHVENSEYYLVEKLAKNLLEICFKEDPNCNSVKITIRKPGAVRFAESVGVTIMRKKNEK
ncbi:MAG: dihydroneopterin aldolase [Chloroflexi bacterium]|nr:dihydroneopterin aldolase [Chloroflexota bacterium]MBR91643.1 dihydroneopterin aldolase [Dehalococcoidia bacterium]MQG09346.1 dihydroneopterin aldolase [SAR202 cluster bacterium]|tara:strand:- start:14025 stop:14390 length:366 start_codon:yes stop_codon:yes gene_type:complete